MNVTGMKNSMTKIFPMYTKKLRQIISRPDKLFHSKHENIVNMKQEMLKGILAPNVKFGHYQNPRRPWENSRMI
jgi:hypothetical protein